MDLIKEPENVNTWMPKSYNAYLTNREGFDSIVDAVSNATDWSNLLTSLFESRSDFLVDCNMFPINFTLFTQIGYKHGSLAAVDFPIYIGTQELNVTGKYFQDSCLVITNDWHYNDLRQIDNLTNRPEFMLKSPYISTDLYIPFFGRISINPAYIHERWVSITYVVSLNTGYCNAYVLSKESDPEVNKDTTDLTYIWSGETKISAEVPFGKVDGQGLSRNIGLGLLAIGSGSVNSIAGAVGSIKKVATIEMKPDSEIPGWWSPVDAEKLSYQGNHDFNAEISSARMVNNLNSSLGNIHNTPNIVSGSGYNMGVWAIDTKSYLIVRYSDVVETSYTIGSGNAYVGYGKLKGRPLCRTVKNLRIPGGFTMIDSVHIEGEGFKNSLPVERDMISRALHSGVILPEY